MPVLQLIVPDVTPDAGHATFFSALIVAGLFFLQFAAMYTAGQDKIRAQEETILQQQAHMALLEFNSSLDHFTQQLGDGFWRCHRSFLVNRSRIRAVHLKEQTVELDNGETCLLSRKAKSEYRAD